MLIFYLHCHGKVVLSLWWKENIHRLLCERLISRRWISNLNNMQLPTLHISYGKTEQSGVRGVAFHAELGEGCRMTFNGLTDLPFHRVELKEYVHIENPMHFDTAYTAEKSEKWAKKWSELLICVFGI